MPNVRKLNSHIEIIHDDITPPMLELALNEFNDTLRCYDLDVALCTGWINLKLKGSGAFISFRFVPEAS